jgi:hypothetical protein
MTTTEQKPKLDAFDLFGLGVLHLAGYVFLVAWWAVLFPMVSLPLVAALSVGVLVGWVPGVVVVGVFAAGMVLWRSRSPQTFERWITGRARSRFLAWWRYRRNWARRMTACNLSVRNGENTLVPRLQSVQIGESVDRLRVRMLEGQCPEDYESRVLRLAHTFGARDCRASIVGPGVFELVMQQRDSLAPVIALPRIGGTRGKDAA